MTFLFVRVPVYEPSDAEAELNALVQSHAVISLEKHFVNDGEKSCWAFCIKVRDGAGPLPAALRSQRNRPVSEGKIDYKAVLSDADFVVFARLRELRKVLALQEGVPAYNLFTNQQLASMAQRRPTSLTELGEIEGVGEARLNKYGEAFLKACQLSEPSA